MQKRKQYQRPNQVLRQRHFLIACTVFTFISGIGLLGYFFFSQIPQAEAASNGDFRSKTSGNWNSAATWQKYNGSSWINAPSSPTSADKAITIQNGHNVSITGNITVDQVSISSGGSVTVQNGITFTVANGSGTDLTVSGTLSNSGTVTINSGASMNVQNGGVYNHNFTTSAGTIPSATWSTGSTCEVSGYTTNTSAPGNLQSFYNLTWNCPAQTGSINLNGGLTTINGDLNIISTGSGSLVLSNSGTTVSIGDDFNLTDGNFMQSDGSSQTSNLNVSGDYVQTGGTFNVVTGNNSTGNVNLSGNMSHTGGTITVGGNAATNAQFYFKKSGTQSYTASGNTVSGNVDYTVNNNSILNLSTNILNGRNFTLSSGGGIRMGSSQGISASGATGNVQVTGTRSFNTNADYTFDGSVAQVTGSGLPGTLRKLTINNSSGLTLQQTTVVTSNLYLTNGIINAASFELQVTNTSGSSVSGQSSSSYITGILRRSVNSSGTYDFPIGTSANYELMTVKLSSVSGISSLAGNFVNSNPVDPAHPISGLEVNDIDMTELLDYGYWTITPNAPMGGGSYNVTLNERGYSNSLKGGSIYAVVTRNNSASDWASNGNHSDADQGVNGATVYSARTGLTSVYEYAIATGQYLSFSSPVLISGTDGQVDAIYKFPNVMYGIDAWVKITGISGGAVLNDIDNSGTGYTEAFQPFIDYAPNTTGYIQWLIMFKKAGSSTDTTIRRMTATGVDVDGGTDDSETIQEFIEATMPTSYSLDPLTLLTITNLGGSYRALGSTVTVNNIDTTARQAMYQMNYNNVSSIMYKTGSISTYSSTETRQTSLYFRSFNLANKNIALPIELISFDAELRDGRVELRWATASEINNDYFTIERSTDGRSFQPIKKVRGSGNSTTRIDYQATDDGPLPGYSYYRLRQTDYDGTYTFSEIKTVKNGKARTAFDVKTISPNPFKTIFRVGFVLDESALIHFTLISLSGMEIKSLEIQGESGYNTYEFTEDRQLPAGIYFVVMKNGDQAITRKIIRE